MIGAESLEDTTFINTRNANIYHFTVGQTCVSVIRALPKKCPRQFEGISDECQAVIFDSDYFDTSNAAYSDSAAADPSNFDKNGDFVSDWHKVQDKGNIAQGELTDSSFMDGNHGTYQISKGHWHCWDPYPEAATLQEQYEIVKKDYKLA